MGKRTIGLLALVALAGSAYYFRADLEAHPEIGSLINAASAHLAAARDEPRAEYLTARIQTGMIEQTVSVTGTLNAVLTVELGSQLSGQVSTLFVDFNDRVGPGDPLAQLDQQSFRARVDEADAALAMARANVNIQRARIKRAQIALSDARARRAIIEARLDDARIRLEASERDLARKQTLADRAVGSATSVEDARTAAASAAAALRGEEAELAAQAFSIAGASSDLERLHSELQHALGTVSQRQALLEIAEIDLERTTIRSPISGIVIGRGVNEGQMIATGLEARTIFVIARDLSEMEIHARVDETDIGRLQPGQRAFYTVDAFPDRQFEAVVRQVRQAAQVTQNVVTYTVVLGASNPEGLLLPGMTAVVRIIVDQSGPVLTMPLAALRYSPQDPGAAAIQPRNPEKRHDKVWVVAGNGRPAPVEVGLGPDDSQHVAVLRGAIAEGDHVVVGEASRRPRNHLFGIRLGF